MTSIEKDPILPAIHEEDPDSGDEGEGGHWVPISDVSMFCGNQEGDRDETNWDAVDYKQARDVEWYRGRFPGFDDDMLEILAKCDGTCVDEVDKPNTWETRRKLNDELAKHKTVFFD